jgi:fucose permease
MTWIWPEDKSAFWLQINNAFFGVGALLAPVLVGWDLEQHNTFHTSYLAIAGGSLAAALLLLCMPSPPPPKLSRATAQPKPQQATARAERLKQPLTHSSGEPGRSQADPASGHLSVRHQKCVD